MTTSRTVGLSQVALNITRIISHLTGISKYPRHFHKQGGYVSIDLITDCQLSEMLKCTKKEIVQPASVQVETLNLKLSKNYFSY